jgi:SAM-dependent methyltransferase
MKNWFYSTTNIHIWPNAVDSPIPVRDNKKEELYKFKRYADLSKDYWWFKGIGCICDALLKAHDTDVTSRKGPHLDIGCGSGASLRSSSAIGMDISYSALSICRQYKVNKLLQCRAEMLPFKESTFGLVTAEGVIEHINDDILFLREVFRVMRSNGLMLIFTSAYGFLWSHHDRASGHVRRYDKRQLEESIKAAGFKIVKISYVNFLLFPFIALVRIIQKITGVDRFLKKEDLIVLPPAINYFLTRVFYLESLILKKHSFPFGVSLICLAKKE